MASNKLAQNLVMLEQEMRVSQKANSLETICFPKPQRPSQSVRREPSKDISSACLHCAMAAGLCASDF
jgi:hypothetical protein